MSAIAKELVSILRAAARKLYLAEEKADASGEGFPYSPVSTARTLAAEYGLPFERVEAYVSRVYWAENGSRAPLDFDYVSRKTGLPTTASVARAVRKARDAAVRSNDPKVSTLGRWGILRYRVSAGLGLPPYSEATIKRLYEAAGGDRTLSYTGRGTRAEAYATRVVVLDDVAASLGDDGSDEG